MSTSEESTPRDSIEWVVILDRSTYRLIRASDANIEASDMKQTNWPLRKGTNASPIISVVFLVVAGVWLVPLLPQPSLDCFGDNCQVRRYPASETMR